MKLNEKQEKSELEEDNLYTQQYSETLGIYLSYHFPKEKMQCAMIAKEYSKLHVCSLLSFLFSLLSLPSSVAEVFFCAADFSSES